MQRLIDTSTAFYGGGNAPTRKLFTINAGGYLGRQIIIYSASPSTIKFSYADPPYSSWSTPQVVAANAADYPVCGWMDADGNVYVAYTAQTTFDLLFRKLTFTAGVWTIGNEVTIYNDKDNYFPTIIKDASGKLTVCWTCYDIGSGNYTLRAKQSSTEGAVWGGGPNDAGTALTAGSSGCYSQLLYLQPYIYVFYTDGGTKLAYRRIVDGAVLWDDEVLLYTGSSLQDLFSAAISESGSIIGIAFVESGRLSYMESDTVNWSGVYAIATSPATPPLLLFNGAVPYVLYGTSVGSSQIELKYRSKSGTGFAPESDLNAELARFRYVLLYDADGSPNFQNLTTAAGNATAADVFHGSSNRLIQTVNDAIYLGADEKFAACQITLSTAGDSSGIVSWAYYNGSGWTIFTPQSGNYNFDQTSKKVRLWSDSASAPSDWQKTTVDLKTAYWIKVTVTTAFSTAPIGSQLPPLTNINYLNR